MVTREIAEVGVALLEDAFNRLLNLDPSAHARLTSLHGKVIRVEVVGLGLRLYCVPGLEGVQLFAPGEGELEPDCVLRGTPLGFARLGLGAEPADELFQGGVEMRGDTEVGQRFGALLAQLDIDWEEQLSRLTGDVVAHRVGQGVRDLGRWGQRTGERLTETTREYLQEEARLLPSHWEAEEFAAGVEALRDDAERLAARVERLRKRLGGADEPTP